MNLGLIIRRAFSIKSGRNISAPHLVEDALDGRYRLWAQDGAEFTLKPTATPHLANPLNPARMRIKGRVEKAEGGETLYLSFTPSAVERVGVLIVPLILAIIVGCIIISSGKPLAGALVAVVSGAIFFAFAWIFTRINLSMSVRWACKRIKELL